jgi:hypothetical protein
MQPSLWGRYISDAGAAAPAAVLVRRKGNKSHGPRRSLFVIYTSGLKEIAVSVFGPVLTDAFHHQHGTTFLSLQNFCGLFLGLFNCGLSTIQIAIDVEWKDKLDDF